MLAVFARRRDSNGSLFTIISMLSSGVEKEDPSVHKGTRYLLSSGLGCLAVSSVVREGITAKYISLSS